ncbi:MAG: NAD-dependent protein deacetylase [Halioglobus sp.]
MNNSDSPDESLKHFLHRHPKLVVLSGAGISAASGIPTYRDESGRWQHSKPIQHNDFLASAATRRRYWARSMNGWPVISNAIPNAAHHALAQLERNDHLELLITQNVDRLHQKAGSRRVIDLHGRLDRVRCLQCQDISERTDMQRRLTALNPDQVHSEGSARPDGDSELPDTGLESFKIPDCDQCGGRLMPDVVFFGANIPRARTESCIAALERADALLVIGSSLQVYSGFRFCKQAKASGKAIAILNPGATRADDLASLKINEPAECLLPGLV